MIEMTTSSSINVKPRECERMRILSLDLDPRRRPTRARRHMLREGGAATIEAVKRPGRNRAGAQDEKGVEEE